MKILRVRAGVLVTVTGLLLFGAGVATAQAAQAAHAQFSSTMVPACPNACDTPTTPASPPPNTCECTHTTPATTPSETTTTPTETTTTPTDTTTTPTNTETTPMETPSSTPPTVLGTTAAITPSSASPTTPVTVLGVQAAVTHPLPLAAAAGQVDTGGQLLAGGLAAFGAFLTLAGGFMLRRRHGDA